MDFIQKCYFYVREIENYCGSDSLDFWYKYCVWLERNASETSENNRILEDIFCKCLSIFENITKYKQDRRLIKIFIKYVKCEKKLFFSFHSIIMKFFVLGQFPSHSSRVFTGDV